MGGALKGRSYSIVFGIVLLAFGGVVGIDVACVPLSFGVEVVGGEMVEIIPRTTILPSQKSKVFTTARDQQTNVTIQVFEGVDRLTKNCLFLGEFSLTGIPPAPRGIPQIKITFKVDYYSNLIVKAEDEAYGISENITIPYHNFTVWFTNVKQMMREAKEEEKAEKDINDKHKEHEIETSTNDENLFYDSEVSRDVELLHNLFSCKPCGWMFKNNASTSDNQIAAKEDTM